jgi:sugar phosphate isomerase/epimerase
MSLQFSLFTKPWKQLPIPELGRMARALGFDGIELPVRLGFQVETANIARDLPVTQQQLRDCGISIYSVATAPTREAIAACGKLAIPVIRVMVDIGPDGYMATERRVQEEYRALQPALLDAGVTIGVQNHNGNFVCNAMGLRHLLEPFDPKAIGAVWDLAHNALNGEALDLGLDIIWPHLIMVNLKNAFWQRSNGPEAEAASWKVFWTTGRHGLASWPQTAVLLKQRSYSGVVCLTAEYTDETAVDRLIAEDIAFAKSLFAA